MPELDDRWEAVILRCLAREPRRRFARAEEVAEALAGPSAGRDGRVDGAHGRASAHACRPSGTPSWAGSWSSEELERNLAGSSRLVTLVGAGGMGKTRLAVRYGWRSLGEWPGGVWFCDLTEARSLNGIASAVAGALGVQLGRGDPVEQLGHAIAGRGRCLMILDNFEQVVEHAAATVGRWLERAGEARFLVTSRERLSLGCRGASAGGRAPLDRDRAWSSSLPGRDGCVRGSSSSAAEAEAAREIVRLVDGMPLAIELAAARMRVMSATQIVSQMRKRFQPADRRRERPSRDARGGDRRLVGAAQALGAVGLGAVRGVRRRLHAGGGGGGARPERVAGGAVGGGRRAVAGGQEPLADVGAGACRSRRGAASRASGCT